MHMFIKPLNDQVAEFYRHHVTYHEGDSGLDLFVPITQVLKAHCTTKVNFQIACEAIRKDGTPTSFYLYPRSSISKTPLRMANCVGIIDAGYRGPILCALDNMGDVEYELEAGTRLVQICGPSLEPITFQVKAELTSTTRGSDGFGSTGM